MYESIRFEGLRALDNVELEGLRRVNLIVGKNNVGKTTVLEGLLLLGGATNPAMLLTLGQMRGQRWDRARPEPEPIWRSFSHAFDDGRVIAISGHWKGELNERKLEILRKSESVLTDSDEDPTVARAFGDNRLSGVVSSIGVRPGHRFAAALRWTKASCEPTRSVVPISSIRCSSRPGRVRSSARRTSTGIFCA